MKKLNLNAIRIDGGTQPRERINMEVVGDYAEGVKVGIEFPPIIVFNDGAEHWLADGFHRYHAHKQAGKASIAAEVQAGTLDDAKLHASGANGTHGLRRSNEDKRRAVEMALSVAACEKWSDTKLADHCGVSVPFVSAIRRPEVAEKQQARNAETARRREEDRKPITVGEGDGARVEPTSRTSAAPASGQAAKPAKRELAPPPAPDHTDELAEAQHTITDLATENETLRDRIAVEAMDASEDEKTQAAETIRELRAKVKTLEAELDAVKRSRDTFMRENGQMKNQLAAQRRDLDKLRGKEQAA